MELLPSPHCYAPVRRLPNTEIGTFTRALYDEARKAGRHVLGMKNLEEHLLIRSKRAMSPYGTERRLPHRGAMSVIGVGTEVGLARLNNAIDPSRYLACSAFA